MKNELREATTDLLILFALLVSAVLLMTCVTRDSPATGEAYQATDTPTGH